LKSSKSKYKFVVYLFNFHNSKKIFVLGNLANEDEQHLTLPHSGKLKF